MSTINHWVKLIPTVALGILISVQPLNPVSAMLRSDQPSYLAPTQTITAIPRSQSSERTGGSSTNGFSISERFERPSCKHRRAKSQHHPVCPELEIQNRVSMVLREQTSDQVSETSFTEALNRYSTASSPTALPSYSQMVPDLFHGTVENLLGQQNAGLIKLTNPILQELESLKQNVKAFQEKEDRTGRSVRLGELRKIDGTPEELVKKNQALKAIKEDLLHTYQGKLSAEEYAKFKRSLDHATSEGFSDFHDVDLHLTKDLDAYEMMRERTKTPKEAVSTCRAFPRVCDSACTPQSSEETFSSEDHKLLLQYLDAEIARIADLKKALTNVVLTRLTLLLLSESKIRLIQPEIGKSTNNKLNVAMGRYYDAKKGKYPDPIDPAHADEEQVYTIEVTQKGVRGLVFIDQKTGKAGRWAVMLPMDYGGSISEALMKDALSLGNGANLIRTEVHEFKPGTILQLGITRATSSGQFTGIGGFPQAYAVRYRGSEFERIYKAGGVKEALDEAERLSGTDKEKALAEIQKYQDITRVDRLPLMISKLEKTANTDEKKEDLKRYKEELALAKSRLTDGEFKSRLNPGYDNETMVIAYDTPKLPNTLRAQVSARLAAINSDSNLTEAQRAAKIEELRTKTKLTFNKLSEDATKNTKNLFGTHLDCQWEIFESLFDSELRMIQSNRPASTTWILKKHNYEAFLISLFPKIT
jgi:hypothetical protein